MKKGMMLLLSFSAIAVLGLSSCERRRRNYLIFYVWGSGEEKANYEQIASEFTEKNGIQVKVEVSSDTYFSDLVRRFSNKNQAPDIFFVESGQFSELMATGKLLNLSEYISNGTINVKTDSNPEGTIELWDINNNYKYDGQNYGDGDYYALIKDWTADFALWYNKDYINLYNEQHGYIEGDEEYMNYPDEKIPMSWDKFMDMSFKIQSITDTKLRHGTAINNVPYKHVFEWVQQNGGSTWAHNGYDFNFADKKLIEAFQYFTNLQTGPMASAVNVIDANTSVGDQFHNGEIAFMFNGNWIYSSAQLDTVSFNFGICPPPVPKTVKTEKENYAGCASMVGLGVYRSSSNKTKAVKFIDYYMNEGQTLLASKGFNVPGNKLTAYSSAFTDPKDKKLKEINKFFLDICNNYTHSIIYNSKMSQEKIEGYIQECFKPYLADPTQQKIEDVLYSIYVKIKGGL